jgi:GT2 family glycosyltransferase
MTYAFLGLANAAILVALVLLNLFATALTALGARADAVDRRRQDLVDIPTITRSPLTTALSVIVPVRDQEAEIVRTVHALLDADYPTLEVILVDDGSRDATIATLRSTFSLVQVERVPRSRISTARLRRAYASRIEPRLLVLEKDPGGRADALNMGLRFARYPLVCPVDPQIAVDRDAFARLAGAFQAHPETIACGATTRIRDTGSPFARLQSLTRLRSVLVARTGVWQLGAPMLGADAINVFARGVLVDAGGWQTTADGEDLELALRLRRHCVDDARPFRVAALTQPVGTSGGVRGAGARLREANARARGARTALRRHRSMLFRSRYGTLGWFVLPTLTLWSSVRRPLSLVAAACVGCGLAAGAAGPLEVATDVVLVASATLGLSFASFLLDRRPADRRPRITAEIRIQPV